MSEVVPPIPYKTPVINETGYLTEPWSKWFRQLFTRIGGTVALSNLELAALEPTDVVQLQLDVVTLQTTVAGLQGLGTDLNQGPVL